MTQEQIDAIAEKAARKIMNGATAPIPRTRVRARVPSALALVLYELLGPEKRDALPVEVRLELAGKIERRCLELGSVYTAARRGEL